MTIRFIPLLQSNCERAVNKKLTTLGKQDVLVDYQRRLVIPPGMPTKGKQAHIERGGPGVHGSNSRKCHRGGGASMLWPVTHNIDRVAWVFLKSDMRHRVK